MKLKFTPLFIAVAIVTIAACNKQGSQGSTSKANVIYSKWDTLHYAWKDSIFANGEGNAFINYIDYPLLDSFVLKQADVRVFMTHPILLYVSPLPIRFGDTYTDFILTKNRIILTNRKFATNASGSGWQNSTQFRYIIIPGGTPATGRTQQESYSDLCKRLGVPE